MQVGGKTGTVKPTKLNIKPRSYEPMPLKYRCLRAAEEYRQRFIKRAEALQRRNQVCLSIDPKRLAGQQSRQQTASH